MACSRRCTAPSPAQAHCADCHQTFAGVSYFDMHRAKDGSCVDPKKIIIKNQDGEHKLIKRGGVWRTAAGHANAASKADRLRGNI